MVDLEAVARRARARVALEILVFLLILLVVVGVVTLGVWGVDEGVMDHAMRDSVGNAAGAYLLYGLGAFLALLGCFGLTMYCWASCRYTEDEYYHARYQPYGFWDFYFYYLWIDLAFSPSYYWRCGRSGSNWCPNSNDLGRGTIDEIGGALALIGLVILIVLVLLGLFYGLIILVVVLPAYAKKRYHLVYQTLLNEEQSQVRYDLGEIGFRNIM